MAALTKYVDSGRRRLQRAGADSKNIARCGPARAPGRMLTWRWRNGRCAGADGRWRNERRRERKVRERVGSDVGRCGR
ncbi:hypothetical protein C5O75_029165 [Burkholderia cepacia]|nr:hypothetical protein C5O75_029165 [Burkholderia cepacia]